ncbi:MAG: UDP-N-acetylmuramate--L-alanine ligase [Treponema sp.]|jgi:UDP-N-acetylmuramate--alanine ligase|nr:UDP-N-acetylmuramate--L-alanine ligase [Treponema sp.]
MDFERMLRSGAKVYFVGIKGTGMCALAELMHNSGTGISGSDRNEVFYTDEILKELGIPYHESFDAFHIRDETDLVIHSAAYSIDSNPELREAERRGIPILKYTDALGAYSALFDSSGIAGVHGKTTTTAMAGTLIRAVGLAARVLAGSAVGSFGGRSTLSLGDRFFVAETCEYRRHFLSFHPRRIVLTAVEPDHQDYFPTYRSIRDAFVEYCGLLPPGGELIYCADDPGACEVADIIRGSGTDLFFTPYGFGAEGDFRILSYHVEGERALMRLSAFPGDFRLRVPGRHEALDAAAALALTSSLLKAQTGTEVRTGEHRDALVKALEDFSGSKRRSEILGEAGGVLFMDDYAHHPTAIATTLAGLKDFYPHRRLLVSFMSHTYSRTAALLDGFASSFADADVLILHKIYASAREEYHGGVNGRTLFEKAESLRKETEKETYYFDEPAEAAEPLNAMLKKGDLFITLGAGDNWKLSGTLYKDRLKKQAAAGARP